MQTFDTREDLMKKIVLEHAIVLEIGVFTGDFAAFLTSLHPAELHLVDPWFGNLCSGNADGNNIRCIPGDEAYMTVCNRFRDDASVRIHRAWSPAALEQFADHTFDVAYLDGDHTFEGSYNDLNAVRPKIKDGGFICGHDFGKNPKRCSFQYTFGVRKAVDLFCKETGYVVLAMADDGYQSFAIQVSGAH
jgi:hypothetical protein